MSRKFIIWTVILYVIISGGIILLNWIGLLKDNRNVLIATLITSVTGFAVQIVAVYMAFKYGLDSLEIQRKKRANEIYDSIDVNLKSNYKIYNNCMLIVKNNSDYPISECVAYISINNMHEDLLSTPPGFLLFDNREESDKIDEVKLSWDKAEAEKRFYKIDIHSKEKQDLLFCKAYDPLNNSRQRTVIDHNYRSISVIEIPSEEGYSDKELNNHSRCLLIKKKDYEFTIKIVCKETKGKEFTFKYILDKDDFEKL